MKTKAMKCWKSYSTAILSTYQRPETPVQMMLSILEVLHKVAFGGDHLTVERGISAAAAVGDSDTPFERLEGLILKHEDFHCKMNVLQVGYIVTTFTSFELRNVGVAVVQPSFSGVHISRKVSRLFNSFCSECKH